MPAVVRFLKSLKAGGVRHGLTLCMVLVLQVTPEWERLTAQIENDEESKDKLGWVREMYAWSVGAALQVRMLLLRA